MGWNGTLTYAAGGVRKRIGLQRRPSGCEGVVTTRTRKVCRIRRCR